MMKPYCYIFQFYEQVEVFPTLRKLIEFFVNQKYPAYSTLQDTGVICHFLDGKQCDLKIDNLVEKVELNLDKIRIEARELIEQDKKDKSEFFAKYTIVPMTGSAWLCDLGEESVIQNLINKKCYKWKDLDTVDWELIENNLHENIHS